MSTTTGDFLRHLRKLTARQALGSFSDQQLLERFRLERSEASFAVLVQRHGPMVLSVCRRVLHQAQDVEDAFQATFLVLAKKAATLRQPPLLSGWLHGVAYHVALRLKAKAQRRAAHERRVSPLPPGDALEDITWRELRSVLDEELGKLPEKYRAPLVLCYLEARTQDEAARQLGWSKNTFGRRMKQARQMLARRLTRRGLTLPAVLTAPLLIDGVAIASVPPLLIASTARAGLAAATGNTLGGMVSAQVVALAEGGVASLLTKKTSISLVLLLSLMLGAGGLLAQRAVPDRAFIEAPAAPPPQSPPARNAGKDETLSIKGRVLDPDGKPLAGARLLLLSAVPQEKTDKPVRATTDSEGRFRLTAQPADFDVEGKATLAAAANGFGPDWIEVKSGEQDAVTLRLVKDDVPIEGRVLDLEGQPVPGVGIHVARLMRGDLDAWLQRILAKGYVQLPERIGPEILGESATTVSGKDGRFRLTGLGRDRAVDVQLRGEKVEASNFEVVTRLKLPPGLSKFIDPIYSARFVRLAGPSKPIVGTIRDKRTSKPLAGITVAYTGQTWNWLWATTDAQGRYRITGVGKRKQYAGVAAGGAPYFNSSKHDVADTPGLEPITVDFALERGIAVHGKLLDKVTGRPIRGEVHYHQLRDNPNLKHFTHMNNWELVSSGKTKADGSFTVAAVPGPGLLAAHADDDLHYLRTKVEVPESLQTYPEQYHTLVPIAPSEANAQSTLRDIVLEPGRIRNGTVVGPDGKPLAGAHFAGLSGTVDRSYYRRTTLETASFTVGGLSPKQPRSIVFVHAAKKLAKVQEVRGDATEPLTIRLGPLGAASGRVLDSRGRPCAGLKVEITHSAEKSDYQHLPVELLHDYWKWSKIIDRKATTDAEGRFRIEGLVPGLKYLLNVKEEGAILKSLTRDVAVESGKTKDLGDLKSK